MRRATTRAVIAALCTIFAGHASTGESAGTIVDPLSKAEDLRLGGEALGNLELASEQSGCSALAFAITALRELYTQANV